MNLQMQVMAMKAKLSTLWMFYLFNTISRDIHKFVEPGFIEQVMTDLFEINNGTTDMDDTFHLIFKIVALLFIIWSAWRWRISGYPTSQEA